MVFLEFLVLTVQTDVDMPPPIAIVIAEGHAGEGSLRELGRMLDV